MGRLARRNGVTAQALALAVGLALTLPTDPASALGPMKADLRIQRFPEHICGDVVCGARLRVTVHALMDLAPGEDPSYLRNYTAAVRIWGDDPVYDDLLRGPTILSFGTENPARGEWFYVVTQPTPTTRGHVRIQLSWSENPSRHLFNEDIGPDEIYAGVRLLRPPVTGLPPATVRSDESNRVHGDF